MFLEHIDVGRIQHSCSLNSCTTHWQTSIIIVSYQEGNDPGECGSFQPIASTGYSISTDSYNRQQNTNLHSCKKDKQKSEIRLLYSQSTMNLMTHSFKMDASALLLIIDHIVRPTLEQHRH